MLNLFDKPPCWILRERDGQKQTNSANNKRAKLLVTFQLCFLSKSHNHLLMSLLSWVSFTGNLKVSKIGIHFFPLASPDLFLLTSLFLSVVSSLNKNENFTFDFPFCQSLYQLSGPNNCSFFLNQIPFTLSSPSCTRQSSLACHQSFLINSPSTPPPNCLFLKCTYILDV